MCYSGFERVNFSVGSYCIMVMFRRSCASKIYENTDGRTGWFLYTPPFVCKGWKKKAKDGTVPCS